MRRFRPFAGLLSNRQSRTHSGHFWPSDGRGGRKRTLARKGSASLVPVCGVTSTSSIAIVDWIVALCPSSWVISVASSISSAPL
jgi:hypothetical protein